MSRSVGVILLCVFLFLFALATFGLTFKYFDLLIGGSALFAAIFLALGK